jgi:hypothetical protein
MPNHMFVVNFGYVNDVELAVSEVAIPNRFITPLSNTITPLIFRNVSAYYYCTTGPTGRTV